jgi:hypothetical protein
MPHLSLKWLLLYYLNLAVSTIYQGKCSGFIDFSQDDPMDLPYLLRISKSASFCHQQIPLKRILVTHLPCYTSAIPRRLGQQRKQPLGEIAETMIDVLKLLKPLLSVELKGDPGISDVSLWEEISIEYDPKGDIQFHLSSQGVMAWLQRLVSTDITNTYLSGDQLCTSTKPLSEDFRWEIHYAYARCYGMWQAMQTPNLAQSRIDHPADRVAQLTSLSHPAVHKLLAALIDVLDALETDGPARSPTLLKHLCRALTHFDSHLASLQMLFPCDRTFYLNLLQATQTLVYRAAAGIGVNTLVEEL